MPSRKIAALRRTKKMSGSDHARFDSDFCESCRSVYNRARKGNRFARFLQAIEMLVTLGK